MQLQVVLIGSFGAFQGGILPFLLVLKLLQLLGYFLAKVTTGEVRKVGLAVADRRIVFDGCVSIDVPLALVVLDR